MTKVHLSTSLPVSARAVWDTIGGFNNLARWHPAIAKSEEYKEGAATLRKLTLHGGGVIVERLDGKDDRSRSYSYSILEGPLPVAKYHATIHVRGSDDGHSCTVDWSSEFEPSGAPESEAAKVIRGVYEAGFENLRKLYGG
ncbi:MAG TPA: SRPBCC family protein [Dongiaceae bacterium]|nr:SRPBCC family protein [Dongiaceae bacterium]